MARTARTLATLGLGAALASGPALAVALPHDNHERGFDLWPTSSRQD